MPTCAQSIWGCPESTVLAIRVLLTRLLFYVAYYLLQANRAARANNRAAAAAQAGNRAAAAAHQAANQQPGEDGEEEEPYDAQTEMHGELQRIGLSAIASTEFINNGIISTNHLRLLGKEDLERLVKQIHKDNAAAGGARIFIPFIAQTYLHAIQFWANRMYILGQEFDETLIDRDMAQAWTTVMREESEASNVSTDIVKTPDHFKKDMKWRTWKESINNYLHSKIGHASLPLA